MSSEWVYSLADISAGFSIQQTLSQQAQLQSLKPFQFYVQYWDSFDERLNRAGIRLWTEEQPRRQFKLFFQDASGSIRSLSSDEALFRADDIPSMEIRRKLQPLLEPRPLLPHLRIQRKRTPWFGKNMEGKKVLSLLLEQDLEFYRPIRFPGDVETETKPGLTLLRLQGVRGHFKALEEFKEWLEIRIGLLPLENDFFDHYLNLLELGKGKKPKNERKPLHSNLHAPEAVCRVLRIQFEIMKNNLSGTLWGKDIEFLHDFRVACRRSRSILSQLKSAFPEAVIKPFFEDFAWLSRLTSAVRDLDVFLLKLRSEEFKKRFGEISLQPLVGWLEGRRDEEQNLLGSHLQSERFQKFSQSWNAFLHGQSSIDLNTEEPPQIKSLASRRIRRLWQRSLKEGRAIPDEEAHLAFHELRKTCKKLRYLLEAFRPLYSKTEILAPVKSLKQFQDLLGVMNDNYVQKELMKQLSVSPELPEKSRRIAEQLADGYQNQLQEAASGFRQVFEEFSDPTRNADWKRLLEETPDAIEESFA